MPSQAGRSGPTQGHRHLAKCYVLDKQDLFDDERLDMQTSMVRIGNQITASQMDQPDGPLPLERWMRLPRSSCFALACS